MKFKNLLLATTAAAAIAPLTSFAQCDQYTSSLADHVDNDRAIAETSFFSTVYKAKGTSQILGYFGSSTATVHTTDQANFYIGECPEVQNSAPEIIEYNYTKKVNGNDGLWVVGQATDIDGNLSHVSVGNPAIGYDCEGDFKNSGEYEFMCLADVSNLAKEVQQ